MTPEQFGDTVRLVTASLCAVAAAWWALSWWFIHREKKDVIIPYQAFRSLALLFILIAATTVLAISARRGEPVSFQSVSVITLPAMILIVHSSWAILQAGMRRRRHEILVKRQKMKENMKGGEK